MSGALDMAFGAFNKWVVRWSIAVLVASLSMLSGCGVSMEGRAKKTYQYLDGYEKMNGRETWDIGGGQKLRVTPLLAAIMIDPKRAEEMIKAGVSVSYSRDTYASPLYCAASRNACRSTFGMPPYTGDYDAVAMMSLLLEKGADPEIRLPDDAGEWHGIDSYYERYLVMKRPFPEALFCYYNNYRDKSVKLHDIGPDHMKKLKVLVDYGLDIDDGSKRLSSCEDAAKKIVGRKGQVPEVNYNNAEISLAMMSDIDRHGAEALSRWKNPQQYYAEYKEKREKESAERQRQQEIAQERLKAKKQAVSSYIASRPDLSKALNEVVKIGAEREAVYSFISKNGFGRLCETGSNNTFYQSKTCLSEWKVVRRQASSHYSSLDSTYKKQRDWFAGLFGQNASVAAAVVDDRVARTPSDKNVKQQYAPIEQQLIRITESEARAERAESRRREQQQMADFMNHIQTTFERTNRMLDRNMAQTHRVVNQAYASQRVRDVSSSSGYRVRSAPAMRDLNKELEEIDRSFDVSASSGSGGMKSGGVATAGAGSSGKSAYRVCGGPTTVPAMNQVFDVRGLNSGKASPDYQCPAGGKPVVAGAYNLETGNITWLNRPPTYKQEPVRGENGRPNGARVSWDAYRYVCLCSNSGSGTPAGGYQQ